jgi:pimeloyl-ACP methyl ester carboxylesterase
LAQQQAETKLVRNARFVRIDDAGHAVFLDQPERFGAALSAFLKELDASSGRRGSQRRIQ